MGVSPIYWFFVFAAIFVGAFLNAYGLYIDYTHPAFFNALDSEIAGIVLIFSGAMAAMYIHLLAYHP